METPQNLEHLINFTTEEQEKVSAWRVTMEELRTTVPIALNRLTQIETAANPTNAQIIQAVRDMASYQKKVIKILARLI